MPAAKDFARRHHRSGWLAARHARGSVVIGDGRASVLAMILARLSLAVKIKRGHSTQLASLAGLVVEERTQRSGPTPRATDRARREYCRKQELRATLSTNTADVHLHRWCFTAVSKSRSNPLSRAVSAGLLSSWSLCSPISLAKSNSHSSD